MVASQLGQSISKATGFSGHSQYAMFLDMMEQCKKAVWSNESHFFFYIMWTARRRWPGEEIAPGCTMGRKQAGVMLWVMTHIIYLTLLQTFMTVQLPNDDGHFQQDNVPQHAAKLVEE